MKAKEIPGRPRVHRMLWKTCIAPGRWTSWRNDWSAEVPTPDGNYKVLYRGPVWDTAMSAACQYLRKGVCPCAAAERGE